MRVLAISGSLRSQSTNTSVLRALALLAPPELEITLYEGLDQIPPFNPDLEADHNFASLVRFRTALRESAAVVFSTPEYAHGIPGSLKNALDWVVGSGELSERFVTLVNASSRGIYAQASLKEVLTTMNARLLHHGEVTIDLPRRTMTPAEIADDAQCALALNSCLRIISETVKTPLPV